MEESPECPTLCLISEIYEAAGRLPDSKRILERAYRKTPVGRNVLYRLVEVTTALQEYDEALEYYTEYVQAAPHDNNRYILKYKLYRGRGSSVEELIAILEEYLGQEYTERGPRACKAVPAGRTDAGSVWQPAVIWCSDSTAENMYRRRWS